MTAPTDPTSKSQRLKRIQANPERWKVCEGCDAVMSQVATNCPRCHAYRFDDNNARVVAAAKRAAKRSDEFLPVL